MDIVCRHTLSLKESLCGFKFDLKHLSGKTLAFNNLTNVSVIKPNYKKIIPNLGMNKNGESGNLIIEFDIIFPDVLGDDQIQKLSEIL
jgi:DnaJ family protein A protein 2